MDESQYEEMTSLSQAASQLLHHLLTAHRSTIPKRSLVLCGIFRLLGISLLLAKRGSEYSKESQSKAEKCTEIFQGTFISLRHCLEEQFRGNLFYQSENRCHEEFQVHACIVASLGLVNHFYLSVS